MSEQNGEGQVQTQSLPSNEPKNDRMAFYLQENGIEPKADGKAEVKEPQSKETDAGVKPSPETSPVKGDSQEVESKESLPKGAQRRIDVLTKDRYKLREENAIMKARIQRLEQEIEKGSKLKPENFVNDQEYQKHLRKLDSMETQKEDLEFTQNHAEEVARMSEFRTTWAERGQATMKPEEIEEYKGLIASGNLPEKVFSPTVLEFLEDSEVGPKMMYELMKAPEVVKRLNAMRPVMLASQLGRLEDYTRSVLSQASKPSPTQQAKTPQKPVSQAPDPIGQINAGGASTTPSDMDLYEQYSKKRR